MKKFFIIVILVAGFSSGSLAQDVSVVGKDVADALQKEGVITAEEVSIVSEAVQTLVQSGATVSEAKKFVEAVLMQSKVQALSGDELSAKLKQATEEFKDELLASQKTAEHPEAAAEQQKNVKPKDHPAH